MSVKDEIAALRAEFAARNERHSGAPPEKADEAGPAARGEEAFLQAFGGVIDALPADIEHYPRLTALAALGVGTAIGLLIGRRLN